MIYRWAVGYSDGFDGLFVAARGNELVVAFESDQRSFVAVVVAHVAVGVFDGFHTDD